MTDLEGVFRRLGGTGLKLKPKKCQFLKDQVKYLGRVVSTEGAQPDEGKVEAVRSFPSPTSVRRVREFLGLIGFYRRHIANFAQIAKPLMLLTAKYSRFEWTAEVGQAFEALNVKLLGAPILRYPNFVEPFILETDASRFALGAILSQKHGQNKYPIAFGSRQLNKPEQNYSATEKECLAVVWAVRHFRCYLYGHKFKIVTDCQPLKWLINIRDPSSRLARWILQLTVQLQVTTSRSSTDPANRTQRLTP